MNYAELLAANDINLELIKKQRLEILNLKAAVKVLYVAAKDYIDYEHDGDPWTEDARAMGEMLIDDISSDEMDSISKLIEESK